MMKKYFISIILCTTTLIGCSDKFETGEFSIVKVGDRVPEFTISDIGESETYASRDQNVPTLLYFLWSECTECKVATPSVMDVWKTIMDNETVRLVCIARGGDYASQAQAVTYWRQVGGLIDPTLPPPLFYDANRVVFDKFAKQGVPRFYIVDGDGIVRWQQEGVVSAELLLGELMKAKAPLVATE